MLCRFCESEATFIYQICNNPKCDRLYFCFTHIPATQPSTRYILCTCHPDNAQNIYVNKDTVTKGN